MWLAKKWPKFKEIGTKNQTGKSSGKRKKNLFANSAKLEYWTTVLPEIHESRF